MKENEEHREGEESKGTTEKLWSATRKTFHNATFRANQYKRVVQKKIDLASLHKKISNTHCDLGKLIDDNRDSGAADLLAAEDVSALLQKLDSLKQAAAILEEEIEAIKAEIPLAEELEKESSQGE
jgi:uncharacterized membrane protein